MDANGTRFHLLLGRDDWERCSVDGRELREWWDAGSPPRADDSGVAFNDERAELTLRPRLFKFVAAPKDTRPDLINRRGAGRDRYGNWYWIDETGFKIQVRSSGTQMVSDFWSPALASLCCGHANPGEFQLRDKAPAPTSLPLSGLAVTEDHYLVVGVSEPGGLLIFDLHTGGEPRQLLWPAAVRFQPFDVSARPQGGVWILDRVNCCYWGLDTHFNLIRPGEEYLYLGSPELSDFQPLENGGVPLGSRRSFPTGIPVNASSPLAALDPIAIEALPDGTVLILDHDPLPGTRFSKIYRYDLSQRIGEVSTADMLRRIETEQVNEFRLVGYDLAFVPEHMDKGVPVKDRVYVAADDGNQTYAFNLSQKEGQLEWEPVSEYLPMRLFGGKGLVTAGSNAYYDFSENWVPVIAQSRPRFVEEAIFTTPSFDGVEPDCVWHRLMIDGCIPPETRVEIRSRAANELVDLDLTAWQKEPLVHLRGEGSELPFMPGRRPNGPGTLRTADREGTWELLFQRARGRFLQLEIRMSGNERSTPRLNALRAYFPRFSYLNHYLPAVYREDPESASFLDRFLANFEGLYTALEDKIAAVQILFDVRSAPAETLAWLAQWFGIVFDPAWDEPTQRLLIRHAMDVFQFRGTIHGLKTALHLALDPCADEKIIVLPTNGVSRRDSIRIVEKYLTRPKPITDGREAGAAAGLRLVSLTTRWQPSHGGANLDERYQKFWNTKFNNPQTLPVFSLRAPSDPARLAAWEEFTLATFGFIPSFGPTVEVRQWQGFLRSRYREIAALNEAHQTSYTDWEKIALPRDWPSAEPAREDWQEFLSGSAGERRNLVRVLWQEFLARRYGSVRAFNQSYHTSWPAFETVSLFDVLPVDGAPLEDWFKFEGVAMQMRLNAHRFTVLLPVPLSQAFSIEDRLRRLELARRIVELEKPAHTVFDVKFYWEMFRIGEARLQLDTLIDRGSRAPQLLPGLILGRGFVGENHLAAPDSEAATDRYSLGRDPLARNPRKEKRP